MAATGAVPFLCACLAKVPPTIIWSRFHFLMDSGFFGNRPVEFLEWESCGYIVVAKEYAVIKTRAQAVRFAHIQNGWGAGEFRYQLHR